MISLRVYVHHISAIKSYVRWQLCTVLSATVVTFFMRYFAILWGLLECFSSPSNPRMSQFVAILFYGFLWQSFVIGRFADSRRILDDIRVKFSFPWWKTAIVFTSKCRIVSQYCGWRKFLDQYLEFWRFLASVWRSARIYEALYHRLDALWDSEDAFDTPPEMFGGCWILHHHPAFFECFQMHWEPFRRF